MFETHIYTQLPWWIMKSQFTSTWGLDWELKAPTHVNHIWSLNSGKAFDSTSRLRCSACLLEKENHPRHGNESWKRNYTSPALRWWRHIRRGPWLDSSCKWQQSRRRDVERLPLEHAGTLVMCWWCLVMRQTWILPATGDHKKRTSTAARAWSRECRWLEFSLRTF